MKYIVVTVLFLVLAASLAVAPSANAQPISGKDVLAPTAYISFDPVARGMPFQVAVVLKSGRAFTSTPAKFPPTT